MSVTIAQESPVSKEAQDLIEGSEAALREVYPPEECFSYSALELDRPEVTFFIAREDGQPLGCVALCDCGEYGEVKRLFVPPAGRGKGTARALMGTLEDYARQGGHKYVRLETGPKLQSAVALYEKLGYSERAPFGEYEAHPASLFMEKPL